MKFCGVFEVLGWLQGFGVETSWPETLGFGFGISDPVLGWGFAVHFRLSTRITDSGVELGIRNSTPVYGSGPSLGFRV